MFMSFHVILKKGQRPRHPKKAEEGTTAHKEEGREKFISPFWWCSLLSPPQGRGAFPLTCFAVSSHVKN